LFITGITYPVPFDEAHPFGIGLFEAIIYIAIQGFVISIPLGITTLIFEKD